METVREARTWAIRTLEQAGVDSPALTADLLLGRVLEWSRVRVLSRPEAHLRADSLECFRSLIERRSKGEPLQYLTGEQEFFGLALRVTPEVLIPRPETEILVERAISLASGRREPRIVDVGTGSGCIAVAVAHEIPDATLCAVDISLSALCVARTNAVRHGVLDRIRFFACNLLEGIRRQPFFDFVLSNPPYVADSEYNTLPAVVRDHEPHPALFAGASGLAMHRRLVPQAAVHLVPGGYLLLEIGLGQADAVTGLIRQEGLSLESIHSDLQGIPRCVVARKMQEP